MTISLIFKKRKNEKNNPDIILPSSVSTGTKRVRLAHALR